MQQQPPVQAGAQRRRCKCRPDFQLNAAAAGRAERRCSTAWQQQSAKITTFKCDFERWEYNLVFGPSRDIPLNKNKGELSFGRPDKGSFRITEINTWKETPPPPGQPAAGRKDGHLGASTECDRRALGVRRQIGVRVSP